MLRNFYNFLLVILPAFQRAGVFKHSQQPLLSTAFDSVRCLASLVGPSSRRQSPGSSILRAASATMEAASFRSRSKPPSTICFRSPPSTRPSTLFSSSFRHRKRGQRMPFTVAWSQRKPSAQTVSIK
ncbi:hypothetical protein ZHAS_00011878 [Anopheles sinensis]|uniref:Secreted protein n=1 Tax=Anopheles sinensis TaxID=74873 RepID=A0A084W1F3_ANOSI|nr:hypothetical protein ZHAS_00011878 [Anopheles sinensis]